MLLDKLYELGLPADQVNFLLIVTSNLFVGYFHHALRGYYVRLFYSFFMGAIMLFWMYGVKGAVNFLIITVLVYAIMMCYQKRCGFIGSIVALGYLSLVHIYRQYYYYGSWNIDVSMLIMMLVPKLVIVAFNHQDKTVEKPNLLEYYAYLTFYASVVMGPIYEYTDFIKFCKEVDYEKLTIWKSIRTSILYFLRAGVSYAINTVVLMYFPLEYLWSEEYAALPMYHKMAYFVILGQGLRFKFYLGWSLVEANLAAAGISYSQQTDRFDLIRACHYELVQFSFSTKYILEGWNSSIALWLRNYVYNRSIKRMSPDMASLFTMMVSGLWHGFYPVYYFNFIMLWSYGELGKRWFKIQNQIKGHKLMPFFKFLNAFLVETLTDCNFSMHFVLDLSKCLLFMKAVHFYTPIGFFTMEVITRTVYNSLRRKSLEGQKKEESKKDK